MIGAKDVRSWFVGIEATHRTSTGRALAGGDGVVPAAGDFASVETDEPAAHGWMVAVRADGPGSATRVRRMAVGSARSVPRATGPRRLDIAVTRADETVMRTVAVLVGRAV